MYLTSLPPTLQVPKRDCKPVVKRECHNVTVPQFKVVREPKRDRVTVMLPACRWGEKALWKELLCVHTVCSCPPSNTAHFATFGTSKMGAHFMPKNEKWPKKG